MGGIEIYALSVIFVLGIVGLIRGPAKELGVTMALVVLLAVLAQFDALVGLDELPARLNDMLDGFGLGSDNEVKQRMAAWVVYFLVIIATTFMAYHGQDTLKFDIKDPPGITKSIAGWLAGALNGYLIFGTLWYYLRELDYPMQQYSWFITQFTDLAEDMVRFLPQNVASPLIISALALGLLWWRILK